MFKNVGDVNLFLERHLSVLKDALPPTVLIAATADELFVAEAQEVELKQTTAMPLDVLHLADLPRDILLASAHIFVPLSLALGDEHLGQHEVVRSVILE